MISRRISRGLLILGVLSSLSILWADDLAENQARFGPVNGDVEVLPPGASQWIDAHVDMPIEAGDQIQVGEDGDAELAMTSDVLWILNPGSELIIGHTTTQESRIALRRGGILGKVTPGSVGTGGWVFETPAAVVAIRGTEFALLHSDSEGTELGVFQGSVEMSPAETAEGTAPPIRIGAQEAGVVGRKTPLHKLTAFPPHLVQERNRVVNLRKRFQTAQHVWSPYTVEYRKEMRRKWIPEFKAHKPPPRRQSGRHVGHP
jgi:hypothetical protein